uniref:Uncharacterized protein n=1 Tax=Arundo donax TaxID=35708 RepID=A0A0A9AVS1_ARUDO
MQQHEDHGWWHYSPKRRTQRQPLLDDEMRAYSRTNFTGAEGSRAID